MTIREYPFERQHSPELKVKVASLAAEAKIIRRIERRLKKAKARKPELTLDFQSLQQHRREHVRWHARHTHLAYGFIRGLSYKAMEQKCRVQPSMKAIMDMITKYGGPITTERMHAWFAGDNK